MAAAKVIVVTGANKGIGYSIVRGLSSKARELSQPLSIVVTARDSGRGTQAVESLRKEIGSGHKVDISFTQLDVTDDKSVQKAAKEVANKHGGVDVLINNAGIATKGDAFDASVVKETFETNYFGLKRVTDAFLPNLREGGRIVHVSSSLGKLQVLKSDGLKKRFANPQLTQAELDDLVHEFQRAVEDNSYEQKGWPKSAYGASKVAVTAHAGLLARSEALKRKHILAFAICPGWCRTDMAGDQAPRTADQGAETPVLLALAPEAEITSGNGKFWSDNRIAEW